MSDPVYHRLCMDVSCLCRFVVHVDRIHSSGKHHGILGCCWMLWIEDMLLLGELFSCSGCSSVLFSWVQSNMKRKEDA